jgi:hypothetical protein
MGKRESLNDYLKRVKDRPFEWGKHDCLTFTNDAFKLMYGTGWADDWLGRYMIDGKPMRKQQLIKEFRTSNFDSAVDKKLKRIDYIPPLGALVTTKKAQRWVTGVAMGLSTGNKAVFLSKEGLIYLPFANIEQAWIKDGE